MIDDVFVENIVARKKTPANSIFSICTILATFILGAALNIFPILLGYNVIFLTGILTFGLGVLCYFLNKRQNIEYEISLTNENFTVTRIYYQTKRELITEFDLHECIRIAPTTADTFAEDLKSGSLTINSTSLKDYKICEENWYCLVNSDELKYVVIFEFKEKMYKAFRKYNPRNTFFIRIVEKKED